MLWNYRNVYIAYTNNIFAVRMRFIYVLGWFLHRLVYFYTTTTTTITIFSIIEMHLFGIKLQFFEPRSTINQAMKIYGFEFLNDITKRSDKQTKRI